MNPRIWIMAIVVFSPVYVSTLGFAQPQTEITNEPVAHCKTLDEVENAKTRGAIYFEYRDRFWVKVGDDYKGPFRYLRSAKKVLNQYTIQGAQQPAPVTPGSATTTQEQGPYYNPQLVLFPFVEYSADKKELFTIPGGQVVSASQVMIHPEPLVLKDISFGMIDLSTFMRPPSAKPTISSASPSQTTPSLPASQYFAVTGVLSANENIHMPSGFTYWVGAAVLDKNGDVIWRNYGTVDSDLSFKCVNPLPAVGSNPVMLLLFGLGKGKLKTNLRPNDNFPQLDATPYDYHVLCSTTLEMGANWFPPLEKLTQEEYQKLMKEMQNRTPVKKAPQVKR